MLPLAHAFRDGGHDVRWATAAQALPLVVAAGVEAVPSGRAEPPRLRSAARCWPGPGRCRGRPRGVRVPSHVRGGADPADGQGPARHRPRLGPRPDRPRARGARAPLVGAVHGVPSVTHSFGTAVPVGILVETGERLAALWRAHGLEVPPYAGCFRAGYLDICPASVQTDPVDHIPGVQPLRPVPGGSGAPRPGTRSSTSPWAPSRTARTAARGGRGSRGAAGAGAGGRRAADGAGVARGAPTHVRVEAWVDQAEVLCRCSAVVSHGGSGTFLGALARGVPQLCLPLAADQFRNAEGGTGPGHR